MDLAYRLDFVERIGSGIKRIKKLINEYNLKVDFSISSNWYRIIFYRKLQTAADEGLKSLLHIIATLPGIKAKDLPSKLNNRSIKTIERQIKTLKEKGIANYELCSVPQPKKAEQIKKLQEKLDMLGEIAAIKKMMKKSLAK